MKKEIDLKKASNAAIEIIAKEVAEDIRNGEIVIFPTETVYGIGADALNLKAVEMIFEIKGREKSKPLPIMIGNIKDVYKIARDIPESFFSIAQKFMPGPLTVILKKKEGISDLITSGFDTIGVRMPNHNFALPMIKYFGSPIVATSANLSGDSNPKDYKETFKVKDLCHVGIDQGKSNEGVPSTIIDLSEEEPKILRQGTITLKEILDAIE